MSQPLEHMVQNPPLWCGRSWEGLVDRRYATFQQALALRDARAADLAQIVSDFLAFFDETGIQLFRDEEEWIFRTLRPTPRDVLRALEGHIEISALVGVLLKEAKTDHALGVIHHLGELLEAHLLFEEEEIRPLLGGTRPALQSVS